ncbi:MAG: hypothetical protein PHN44_10975 [Candidatus Marinimicrobia bacterium]|nr:hypothetical protein [Candidatus Neomarinimicrobiota bacterium]
MKILPTRWDLISRLKGRRVLDIGGIGYNEYGVRKKLFEEAWSGISRTTMDISPEADIMIDLNEPPFAKVKWGKYDIALMFDVLEHLKYPAEVLEWIGAKELWINLPCATSLYMQKVEHELYALEVAKKIPNTPHIFGFNPLLTRPLMEQCGWRVIDWQYMFDYQSWRGKLFALLPAMFPYSFSQGFWMKCRRK